jgi:hypothetical protein
VSYREKVSELDRIIARVVWGAAALLGVFVVVAMLCSCASGHGIRAMSDRWCAEHGNPAPQCVQP